MRRFIRSLKFGTAQATGFVGFHIWRGLERCLSVEQLFRVAQAYYVSRATFNEMFHRPKALRDRPEWLWKDNSVRARIRRRSDVYLNDVLPSFSDRLVNDKWRSRCRVEGGEHLRSGRPVVLAFFHFGPIYVMRQWAQAHGIPAAIFTAGDVKARGRLAQAQDRLTPFPEIPAVFFFPDELRTATEFLRSGNILFIAVDTKVGRRTTVNADDGWKTMLNTGAARLAHGAGADLVLCAAVHEGGWQYRLKFSPAIPAERLRTEANQAAANQFLFEAILPDFKAYPEQVNSPFKWERAGSGTGNEAKTGQTS